VTGQKNANPKPPSDRTKIMSVTDLEKARAIVATKLIKMAATYSRERFTLSASCPTKIGATAYVRAAADPMYPKSRKVAPKRWAKIGTK